jgi:hypothetical protein
VPDRIRGRLGSCQPQSRIADAVRHIIRFLGHSTSGGDPSLNFAEWPPKVIADAGCAAPLTSAVLWQDVLWRRVSRIVGKREPAACTQCIQQPAEVSFGSETQHTLRQGCIIDASDALRQSPTPPRIVRPHPESSVPPRPRRRA